MKDPHLAVLEERSFHVRKLWYKKRTLDFSHGVFVVREVQLFDGTHASNAQLPTVTVLGATKIQQLYLLISHVVSSKRSLHSYTPPDQNPLSIALPKQNLCKHISTPVKNRLSILSNRHVPPRNKHGKKYESTAPPLLQHLIRSLYPLRYPNKIFL